MTNTKSKAWINEIFSHTIISCSVHVSEGLWKWLCSRQIRLTGLHLCKSVSHLPNSSFSSYSSFSHRRHYHHNLSVLEHQLSLVTELSYFCDKDGVIDKFVTHCASHNIVFPACRTLFAPSSVLTQDKQLLSVFVELKYLVISCLHTDMNVFRTNSTSLLSTVFAGVSFLTPVGITDTTIYSLAVNCSSIIHLNLKRCLRISDDSLQFLSIHCHALLSLSLFGCVALTDEGIHSLARGCVHLQNVDFMGCQCITNRGIESLAQSCPRLKRLYLLGCPEISDVGLQRLSIHCPLLQVLAVSGQMFRGYGIESLAQHCQLLKYVQFHSSCKVILQQCRDKWRQGCKVHVFNADDGRMSEEHGDEANVLFSNLFEYNDFHFFYPKD